MDNSLYFMITEFSDIFSITSNIMRTIRTAIMELGSITFELSSFYIADSNINPLEILDLSITILWKDLKNQKENKLRIEEKDKEYSDV